MKNLGAIGKLVALTVVVVLLLALAFIEVPVPSINTVEGAKAYTQPVVRSSFIQGYGGGTSLIENVNLQVGANDVTQMTLTIDTEIHPYVAPQPVMKPLWKALIGAASLFDIGDISNGSIGVAPITGTKCTIKSQSTGKFDVTTYVELTVMEPGTGESTTMSPHVTWTVEWIKQTLSCDDGTLRTSIVASGPDVEYEFGTYYFTKGWGTYDFQGKIFRADPDSVKDVQVGSLLVSVDVTPEGAGSG